MDPADPRTSLYLGGGDSTSDPRTVTVKFENADPGSNGGQAHIKSEEGVSNGGVESGANGVVVKEDRSTLSPYLTHSLPTSAAAVIPAPGSVLPTSTTPTTDPKHGVLAGIAGGGGSGGSPQATTTSVSTSAPSTQSGSGTGKNAESDGIWVAGLPKTVTVEQLAKYFGEFGELKMDRTKDPPAPLIFIYKDHHTGTPKGEVKIIWETCELAKLAVEYFNNKHWPGHGNIRVELAHPKPDRSHHEPRYQHGGSHHQRHGGGSHYNSYNSQPAQSYPPQPIQSYGAPSYSPYAGAPGQPGSYDYPQGAYPQQSPPAAAPVPLGYENYYAQDPYGQMAPSSSYGYPYPQQNYGPPPGYANAAPTYSQPPPAYPSYGGYPPPQNSGYGYSSNSGYSSGPSHQPRMFKGKGGAARAGDWVCPSCGNNNFTWRTTCKQCTLQRPPHAKVVDKDEDGSAAPSRPGESYRRGSENPNDWMCPKCGFRNFSRREFCHDCRTPRPMGHGGPVRDSGLNEMRRERADAPY